MRQKGFSLVEIMIVMLIVAILLAATAPTITKKVTREQSDKIFDVYSQDAPNAVEYIKGRDQIIYMDGRSNGRVGIVESGVNIPSNSVLFGKNTLLSSAAKLVGIGYDTTNGADSVAIGYEAKANSSSIAIGESVNAGASAIAIGMGTNATDVNAIAIGIGTRADYANTIAVGIGAKAENTNAIAIGAVSEANGNGSVAIGYDVKNSYDNTIMLGNSTNTVYIPGNLVVGNHTVLGANGGMIAANIPDSGSEFMIPWVNSDNVIAKEKRRLVWNGSIYEFADRWKSNTVPWSDRRLKNVGEKYTAGLDELMKLDFFHYTFKADKNKVPQVGVIAQDLQKVFPNSVTTDMDGYLRIRWDEMFYTALNSIKELGVKIKELSENLKLVQNDTKELKAIIEKQQSIIDAQAQMLNEQQKQIDKLAKKVSKLERKNKNLEEQ